MLPYLKKQLTTKLTGKPVYGQAIEGSAAVLNELKVMFSHTFIFC
jgi:hypothetical protein